MRTEQRRRPRSFAPQTEGLESMVLMSGDAGTAVASEPLVETAPAEVAPVADESALYWRTGVADPSEAVDNSADPTAGHDGSSPIVTEVPVSAPAAPEVPAPVVDPMDQSGVTSGGSAPTELDQDGASPIAVTTTSAPRAAPAPVIEVPPSSDNLRVDLVVERTSPFAGRTVRFHTRETNVGSQTIRLEPLSNFDVIVTQDGEVVWKLTDVRRARAALSPSQSFEPRASRGVSVWWDGFRSRGGRGPVVGEVQVVSVMDGVQSLPQTFTIQANPVNTPRPAPQPVRVEVTPPAPAPLMPPPASVAGPASPASPAPVVPPVLPPVLPPTTPTAAPATPPPAVAGLPGSSSNTTPDPTTPPPGPSTPSQAPGSQGNSAETARWRGRRWNTQVYGQTGMQWKQRRTQWPRAVARPSLLPGVQQGARQIRLARLEALAGRLR